VEAIGINIYGGGFTLGVQQADWKVLGQWEECNLGRKTFDLNFSNIPRPLELRKWPISQYVNKVPFVFANPPCAPWSIANNHVGKTRESRFNDKRLELTLHTMKAAQLLEPEVFISESVENGYNIGSSHYDFYRDQWMEKGYSVTYFLSDAILQGAPCVRRRFHFIAHRDKLQLPPEPTLPKKAMTVRDAIGDLIEVDGRLPGHVKSSFNAAYDELLPLVEPYGKLYRVLNAHPSYKGPRAGFLMRRLAWDAPACTMVGFSFIHPDGHRWITFREALRLCTYPDTFMAHNAIEAVDAVLPVVSKFLAETAKKTIELAEPQAQQFSVVDWRPYGRPYHYNARKNKPLSDQLVA
jgi:site-specific DNA-cytosine methylase